MSIASISDPPKRPPDESDPFRYGWRYVTIQNPDGTESHEEVPLTEEDVLFPEEGDIIAQTDLHDTDINYLKDVFNTRLARTPAPWPSPTAGSIGVSRASGRWGRTSPCSSALTAERTGPRSTSPSRGRIPARWSR